MEVLLEGFNDPEDLRVSVSPDEFRDDSDKGMGDRQKGLFLFRMVELLEKLIGIIKKFIGHPFKQNLILQAGGSGHPGRSLDFGSNPPGDFLCRELLLPLIGGQSFCPIDRTWPQRHPASSVF